MGTRALVNFAKAPDDLWATVYVHSVGYPTGVGAKLKACFLGAVMRNGIRDDVKQVNGAGCAAAQFIAAEKHGPGHIYVYKTGATDVGEHYIYTVYGDDNAPLRLKVQSVFPRSEGGQVLYDGPLDDFDPDAAEKQETDD